MKTDELVRHIARELHIRHDQFAPQAAELEKAGLLQGNDIANTVTLLLAAAAGDGPSGIVQRVQERAGMHVAQADTNVWEGPARTKEPATEAFKEAIETGDRIDLASLPLSESLETWLTNMVNRHPTPALSAVTISRDRDLALLESALPQGASGVLLYRHIPQSVFESHTDVFTSDYLDGMETTATINGESLKALAAIIRAQITEKAEAA